MNESNIPNLGMLLKLRPEAVAKIRGSDQHPHLKGTAWFYQTNYGVLIFSDISGLPTNRERCQSPIFAYHIHEGSSCTGNATDEFANAGSHYNPHSCPHPYHAGDLPPLFGANGYALSAVLTDRITVREIIGRTIVIHASPDDFTTQPSGNSGTKIACGKIERLN